MPLKCKMRSIFGFLRWHFLPLQKFIYSSKYTQMLLIYFLKASRINIINYYLATASTQLFKSFWRILLDYCDNLSQLLLGYLFYSLIEAIFLAQGDLLGLFFWQGLFNWNVAWLLDFCSLSVTWLGKASCCGRLDARWVFYNKKVDTRGNDYLYVG